MNPKGKHEILIVNREWLLGAFPAACASKRRCTAVIYSNASKETDGTRNIIAALKDFTNTALKIYAKEALHSSGCSAYHDQCFQAYMELQDKRLSSSKKKKAWREVVFIELSDHNNSKLKLG
eukprot:CAMPEP_0117869700 /NCGR_PEP_ID=MMETSP0950-20121206/9401_1 /TAXON_ID=44440 /ORGANISM="Chattonella subsalsa, Strain CCMP2191" /LENGTH=121 /DNA_ID=CAMNT_0005721847 /DNA_START=260 /DNA_END=625 /DNA_ORIENTATION=-